jgi:hypothetical protein
VSVSEFSPVSVSSFLFDLAGLLEEKAAQIDRDWEALRLQGVSSPKDSETIIVMRSLWDSSARTRSAADAVRSAAISAKVLAR